MRRLLLISACLASALVGLSAVWLFAPTGFLRLDTGDLLAVLALVLMPLLTIWVVRADRAAQAHAAELAVSAQRTSEAPQVEPLPAQRATRKSVIHEPAYMPVVGEQQRV
ncbi:MAG TPA: hypothetical protein VEB22_13455 [Phycisphaerales bacterium]|nr:hypothetical protein [Phycisphaerales bacterium]